MKQPDSLSATEFQQRLTAGQLTLSLVGMSNVGKTFWSQRLAEHGFTHICCDDLIEQKLGRELLDLGYKGGITDMARWLGQPYDPQFAANQRRYLDLETTSLQHILEDLKQGNLKANTVIDTTGSVVHTDPTLRQQLSSLTTVVYLEATPAMQHKMFEQYMAEPKPVVWEDMFQPKAGESNSQALARCYPKLLAYRSDLYAAMAQVTMPHQTALRLTTVDDFLEQVQDFGRL